MTDYFVVCTINYVCWCCHASLAAVFCIDEKVVDISSTYDVTYIYDIPQYNHVTRKCIRTSKVLFHYAILGMMLVKIL